MNCGFKSHPRHLSGSCSPRWPVKPLSQNKRGGRREVQFLHDPLTVGSSSARSSTGTGRQPLTLETRVRLPCGSIRRQSTLMKTLRSSAVLREHSHRPHMAAKWCNWQTRDAQNVVPFGAWEFDSPLGHSSFSLSETDANRKATVIDAGGPESSEGS